METGGQGEWGEGWRRTAATPGRRRTCGLASHHHSPAPARQCPSYRRRRLHIRYPGGRGLRGRGRTAWPPGASSAGDAAVAPRGGGSKSARAGELKAAAEVAAREMAAPPSPPRPQQPGYLILDVLLPPLGSDVRGEVLGELHPAASPSLPPGSGSYRRRRRQQRLRLLPTWAPALREAALLSSSAAAEVSSEPPSRHLPPPLHSPAPPRPLDVIAMVTAYAAPTEGAGCRAWPRGLSFMLRPFGPDVGRHLP